MQPEDVNVVSTLRATGPVLASSLSLEQREVVSIRSDLRATNALLASSLDVSQPADVDVESTLSATNASLASRLIITPPDDVFLDVVMRASNAELTAEATVANPEPVDIRANLEAMNPVLSVALELVDDPVEVGILDQIAVGNLEDLGDGLRPTPMDLVQNLLRRKSGSRNDNEQVFPVAALSKRAKQQRDSLTAVG